MKLMGDDIVVKLERYIDENGIINVWPKKHEAKEAVLQYLSTKFEEDRDYTEKEVNSIIDKYHSFNDYFHSFCYSAQCFRISSCILRYLLHLPINLFYSTPYLCRYISSIAS